MHEPTARPRAAAWVGILGLVGFWALVGVAASRQPGYRAGRDYVSSLASDGARLPGIALVALLLLGTAYLAAALVLRSSGAGLAAVLLGAAGLLTWVVAVARIDCPGGAARCSVGGGGSGAAAAGEGFAPQVHGYAVGASFAFVAVTMAVLAVTAFRAGDRTSAAVSAVALVGSLVTVPFWVDGASPGGPQRLWLAILTGWVAWVCLGTPVGRTRR